MSTSNLTTQTFAIPADNFPILSEKLAKLSRRAAKLGRAVPILTELNVEDRPYEVLDDITHKKVTRYRRYHLIEITSEPVNVNGWTFVATIEMGDAEVGHIINRVPGALAEGEDLPLEFRKATAFCDHCKMARRRNSVYILRHDITKEWKQVGRNCLGQFLGGIDPANVCGRMELIYDFMEMAGGAQDEGYFGGKGSSLMSLRGALELVELVIRCKGWLSRGNAHKMMEEYGHSKPATADLVRSLIFQIKPLSREVEDLIEFVRSNEADVDKVENVIAWARSLAAQEDQTSDYLHNLTVVCSKESLDLKHLGIAASVFAAYDFAANAAKPKEAKADRPVSQHIGTIKKRETFTLTLKRIHTSSNKWGVSNGYFFEDADGNQIVWWASGNMNMEVDQTYRITGSVKEHAEYRGTAQTLITRCKVG